MPIARRVLARRLAMLLLAPLLFALPAGEAAAVTLTVTNLNDSFAGSLRMAVLDSSPGDTIAFAPGVWGGAVALTGGEIAVTHDLTILGPQAGLMAIQGNATSRLLHVTSGALRLGGLTLSGGMAPAVTPIGGLILCETAAASLRVSDCVLTAGHGDGGGLLYSDSAPVLLERTTLSGGSAAITLDGGGGIWCSNTTLTATDCLFQQNGPAQYGGALAAQLSTVTLTRCTFSENSATFGGTMFLDRGTESLTDCTIVTVAGSNAYQGVVLASAAVTVRNSIITGGSAPDVDGAFTSAGYNMIGIVGTATGFGLAGSHDQVGTLAVPLPAVLGPLADNGGPTLTMAPLAGGLAVDQGHATAGTTDARGHARTYDNTGVSNAIGGDGTDVGAVELGPATHWLVTNLNDHGAGSFRQALLTADAPDSVTFRSDLAGTIALTSGELVIKRPCRVVGPGPNVLTVDGASARPVIEVPATATTASVSGLHVTYGAPPACVHVAPGAGLVLDLAEVGPSHCVGLVNDGTLTLTRSLVHACNSEGGLLGQNGAGGGMTNSGPALVTNCTFAADTALFGGGIFNNTGGVLDMRSCTIVGNYTFGGTMNTRRGGGIQNAATATLTSTLVAGNTAVLSGPDLGGAYTSGGFHLVSRGDNSTGFTDGVNQDQVGSLATPLLPQLGPLADNGGPTATMIPLMGSPAIDRGLATGLTTDQRLRARRFDDGSVANAAGGDAADVGACERSGGLVGVDPPPTALAASVDRIDAIQPNPSAGACVVRFTLARAGAADLALFDVAGRRVATLAHGALAAGPHQWAAPGAWPGRVAAGVYWLRLVGPTGAAARRFVLLR